MRTTVRTSIGVAAGFRKGVIFEKVRQLESYPKFMPDVKRVRVLETSPSEGASEWDVDIEGCPLHWLERDRFDHEGHVFEFRSVEGDFEEFSGRWEVLDGVAGPRVEFSVEYQVGIPVIEDIIGPVLKVKMERNTMKMLEHLKQEVEAGEALNTRAGRRLPCRVKTVVRTGSGVIAAVATDVSQGGLAAEAKELPGLGEEVGLVLVAGGREMRADGRVAWVRPALRRFGVQFRQMSSVALPGGLETLACAM